MDESSAAKSLLLLTCSSDKRIASEVREKLEGKSLGGFVVKQETHIYNALAIDARKNVKRSKKMSEEEYQNEVKKFYANNYANKLEKFIAESDVIVIISSPLFADYVDHKRIAGDSNQRVAAELQLKGVHKVMKETVGKKKTKIILIAFQKGSNNQNILQDTDILDSFGRFSEKTVVENDKFVNALLNKIHGARARLH